MDATEFEVIEGFAGLVRLLQPEYVVETGTHRGFMSEAIGKALARNGHGKLHTIELSPEYHAEAVDRTKGLPVEHFQMKSLDFTPTQRIDMAWFDTDFPTRAAEFRAYRERMYPGTIVGFHDAGPHHATVLHLVKGLQAEGLLTGLYFCTPRGMILAQPTWK